MHPRVESYIDNFDPNDAALLQAVRGVILNAHPAVDEKFIYSTPFYALFGNFCYLTFSKKHNTLVLGFTKGHLMDDPHSVLKAESNQKYIRHIFLNKAMAHSLDIVALYVQIAVQIQLQQRSK